MRKRLSKRARRVLNLVDFYTEVALVRLAGLVTLLRRVRGPDLAQIAHYERVGFFVGHDLIVTQTMFGTSSSSAAPIGLDLPDRRIHGRFFDPVAVESRHNPSGIKVGVRLKLPRTERYPAKTTAAIVEIVEIVFTQDNHPKTVTVRTANGAEYMITSMEAV